MTVAIVVVVAALTLCIALLVVVRRRQPEAIAGAAIGNHTHVLRFDSGTTVELDESGERQRRHSAAVAPLPRRRMPGLMPTAGHVVVPKGRTSVRSIVPPRPLTDELDLSDED
jgi:hypothetical protein